MSEDSNTPEVDGGLKAARTKDFDAIIAEAAAAEEVAPTFTLLGREWRCLPNIPAYKMALFSQIENTSYMDTLEFLIDLLEDEDQDDFREAVKDPSISVDILNQVVKFVMEAHSGRPLEGE